MVRIEVPQIPAAVLRWGPRALGALAGAAGVTAGAGVYALKDREPRTRQDAAACVRVRGGSRDRVSSALVS